MNVYSNFLQCSFFCKAEGHHMHYSSSCLSCPQVFSWIFSNSNDSTSYLELLSHIKVVTGYSVTNVAFSGINKWMNKLSMKAYNQFCHQLVHLDGTQKGLEQTPQIQEFHCASCQTSQIPKSMNQKHDTLVFISDQPKTICIFWKSNEFVTKRQRIHIEHTPFQWLQVDVYTCRHIDMS